MVKAYKFMPIADIISHSRNVGVTIEDICSLDGTEVVGFANLLDNGIVEGVDGPSDNPMVLLAAHPHKGASFHILTDGYKYYPLRGSIHLIYDDRFHAKYKPLSEIDQILAKESIKYFLSMFA